MRSVSLSILFCLAFATPALSSSVSWDGNVSRIACDQFGDKLEFTLDKGQNVPRSELEGLCSCIASETNQAGWEIPAIQRIAKGEDPGFLDKNGATYRFGQAVKYCSRGKFYQPVSKDDTKRTEGLSLSTQRILGFVFGGPIGIFSWPMLYQFFSGNLILAIIVGMFLGGISWSASIYIPMMLIAFVVSFIQGK